ncbi:horcolin-like [Lolium rigidum]|uniref:horcolin-like n=1 Tax=Lolium rigidum TaxID=89674 RepID=UPI001F5CEC62|nr:horcolin-like [Lolium rigidum]
MSKPAKIGPWGGAGGDERNVQAMPRRLVSVTIHSGEGIDGISFTYVGSDYVQYTEGPWGRTLNNENTITIDPTDYVTEISGTFGTAYDNTIVTSLKIATFNDQYPVTYGTPNGTPFHIPVLNGGKVVGFFGRSGDLLDAIGVYIHP